jgi:hypothetical protein
MISLMRRSPMLRTRKHDFLLRFLQDAGVLTGLNQKLQFLR